MSFLKKITTVEENLDAKNKLNESKIKADSLKKIIVELKEKNSSKEEISVPANELKNLTKQIEILNQNFLDTDPNKLHINRPDFEKLMTRRFFYNQSFEIYQGRTINLNF
jgi:hypothetical protein